METLYAPWRSTYSHEVSDSKHEGTSEKECVFCTQIASRKDQECGIIKRFEHTVVMLNKYPYNAGHCLVLPLKHVATLAAMTKETRTELMEVTSLSIETIQKALKPHGLNVGLNIGKAAGAGIPAHLHMHILPRWNGDTNFMPTIAQTKVISFDLKDIYQKLVDAFVHTA